MLANLLRRSSSSTTECVDAMELPRLHRVAYLKDSDGLRAMLGKDGVNIDKRDRNGRTALHYGCLAGSPEILEILLERSPQMHLRTDRSGRSPAYLAIQYGNLECLQLLAKRGHSFDEKDLKGISPLHLAISENQPDIAEFFVKDETVHVNAGDQHQLTPLHVAISKGMTGIAKLLIESHANIDVKDCHGRTPLILAAACGAEDCVTLLIEKGANLKIEDYRGLDAKDWAFKKSHERIYTQLVNALQDKVPDAGDGSGTAQVYGDVSHQCHIQDYANGIGHVFQADSGDASCSSDDDDDIDLQQAIEELLSNESETEQGGYDGEDDSPTSSECFKLSQATPSETLFLLGTSSTDLAIRERNVTEHDTQGINEVPKEDKGENTRKISRVHFFDTPEIIEFYENVLPPSAENQNNLISLQSGASNREESQPDEFIDVTGSTILYSKSTDSDRNLRIKEQSPNISAEQIPLITMTVYDDTDEDEFPNGRQGTPVTEGVYTSESDEYTMVVDQPLCKPSHEFIFNIPDFPNPHGDSDPKVNIRHSNELNLPGSSLDSSDENEFVVKSDINIEIVTDETGSPIHNKFADAEKRYRARIEPKGLLFGNDPDEFKLRMTTSNLEINKAKEEHQRTIVTDVGEKLIELSKQRIEELEKKLEEEQQVTKIKDTEIEALRDTCRAMVSVVKNGKDGPEETVYLKKGDVFKIISGESRVLGNTELFFDAEQEMVKIETSHKKEKSVLEKTIQKLMGSNDYYKNKVIKLNNECVKQKTALKMLHEQIKGEHEKTSVSWADETAWCECEINTKERCNGNCSKYESNEHLFDENASLDYDYSESGRNGIDSRIKKGEPEGNILHLKDARKGSERSSNQNGLLAETNDSLIIARQNCHKKIAEELKARFLEKVEKMENELNKVKIDLRLEREKTRRLSLHDELKDRFVVYCERLQNELAEMKEESSVNDLYDRSCSKESQRDKLELDGKLTIKIEEQERTIELLRDCITETRQKQSKYMKLFADAKQKAGMYDELVGSNLQLEEALNNSYETIASLKEKLSALQMKNDKNSKKREANSSGEMQLMEELEMSKMRTQELLETIKILNNDNEGLATEIAKLKNENLQLFESKGTCVFERRNQEQMTEDIDDVVEENRKLVRELWKARQLLDKAENENSIMQEEYRVLESRFETVKAKAEKLAQNNDTMISMEDILEENATLMEVNEEIAAKYRELLAELNIKDEGFAPIEGELGDDLPDSAVMEQYDKDEYVANPQRKARKVVCNKQMKPKLVRQHAVLSPDIKLRDLIRALNSDTEEEDDDEDSRNEIIEHVRRASVMPAENGGSEGTLLEELNKLTQTNNSLKDKVQFLDKWTDDLNEEVLRLQSELETYGKERDLVEEKFQRKTSHCNLLEEEIKKLKKECISCGRNQQSKSQTNDEVSEFAKDDCVMETENAELLVLRENYESLQKRAEEWNNTLSEKIQRLQEYLKETNDENCSLKHENEQLKLMIGKSSDTLYEVEELRNDNDALLTELQSVKDKFEKLRLMQQNASNDMETSDAEKQKMKAEIDNYESRVSQLVKDLGIAKEELMAAKQQFAEYAAQKAENDALKEKLQYIDNINGKIMTENDELLTENTNLHDVMLGMQEEIQNLKEKNKEMKSEIDYKCDESKCIREKVSVLQKNAEETTIEDARLQLAFDDLVKENIELKEVIEGMKMCQCANKKYVLELEKECEILVEETEMGKVDHAALLEKLDELQQQCWVLEAMVDENELLKRSIIDEQEKMAACLQGAKMQRLELEKLQKEHGKLKKQYDTLNEKSKKLVKEVEDATAIKKQQSVYIIELENETEFTSKELDELLHINGDLQKRLSNKVLLKPDTTLCFKETTTHFELEDEEDCKKVLQDIRLLIMERLSESGSGFSLKVRNIVDCAAMTTSNAVAESAGSICLKKLLDALFDENERLVAKVEVIEKRMSDYQEIREKIDTLIRENIRLRQVENRLNIKAKECVKLENTMLELMADNKTLGEIRLLIKERLSNLDGPFTEQLKKLNENTNDASTPLFEGTGSNLQKILSITFDELERSEAKVAALENKVREYNEMIDKLDALSKENRRLKQIESKLRVKESECHALHSQISKLSRNSEAVKVNQDFSEKSVSDSKLLDEISALIVEKLTNFDDPAKKNFQPQQSAQSTYDKRTFCFLNKKEELKDAISKLFDENERLAANLESMEKKMQNFKDMSDKADVLLSENLRLKQMENRLCVKENECRLLQRKLKEERTYEGLKMDVHNSDECAIDVKILEEIAILVVERLRALDYPVGDSLRNIAECIDEGSEMPYQRIKTKLQETISTLFDENERFAVKMERLERKLDGHNEMQRKLDAAVAETVKSKQIENKLNLKTKECLKMQKKLSEIGLENEEIKLVLDRFREKPVNESELELGELHLLFRERLKDMNGAFLDRLQQVKNLGGRRNDDAESDGSKKDDLHIKELANAVFDENERLCNRLVMAEQRLKENDKIQDKFDEISVENCKLKQNCNKLALKEKAIEALKSEKSRLSACVEMLNKKVLENENILEKLDTLSSANAQLKQNENKLNFKRKQAEDKLKAKEKEYLKLQMKAADMDMQSDIIKKESESLRERCKLLAKEEHKLEEIQNFVKEKLIKDEERVFDSFKNSANLKDSEQILANCEDNLKNMIEMVFDEVVRLLAKVDFVERKFQDYQDVQNKLDNLTKENIYLKQTINTLKLKSKECCNLKKKLSDVAIDSSAMRKEMEVMQEKLKTSSKLEEEVAAINNLMRNRLNEYETLLNVELTNEAKFLNLIPRGIMSGKEGSGALILRDTISMIFDENQRLVCKTAMMEGKFSCLSEVREKLDAAVAENIKLKQNENSLKLKEEHCLRLQKKVMALAKESDELKRDLEKLKEENKGIDDVRRENTALSNDCKAYLVEKRILGHDNEVLIGRNMQLKQMLETVKMNTDKLGESVMQSENEILQLKDKLTKLKTIEVEKDNLLGEVDSLKAEADKCKDLTKRKVNEFLSTENDGRQLNSLLQRKDFEAKQSSVDYNHKIEWLSREKEVLKMTVEEQAKRIDVFYKQKTQLEEELASVRLRMEEVKDDNSEVKNLNEKAIEKAKAIKDENEILTTKYESAKNELLCCKERLKITEVDLNKAKNILKKLANERKTMNLKQKNLALEIKQLQKVLQEVEAHKAELESENCKAKKDLKGLKNKTQVLLSENENLSVVKDELDVTQKEAKNILEKYLKIKSDMEDLEARNSKLGNEMKMNQTKLEFSEREKIIIVEENIEIKSEIEMIRKNFEDGIKEIDMLQKNNQELQNTTKRLQSSLEDAFDANKYLGNEKRKMEERLEESLRQNESCSRMIKQKKKILAANEEEMCKLRKDLHDRQEKLTEMEIKNKQMQEKIKDETIMCASFQGASLAFEKTGKYEFQFEREGYSQKLNETTLRMEALEKDIEEQAKAISEKDDEYSELMANFNQLKGEKRDLEQKFCLSGVSLQRYESKLKENESTNHSYRMKVDHLCATIENLQEDNDKLNQLYSECLRENESLHQFAGSLECKLTASQEQLDDLCAKYREARRELKNLDWGQERNDAFLNTIERPAERNPQQGLSESIHGSKASQSKSSGKWIIKQGNTRESSIKTEICPRVFSNSPLK